MSLIIDSFAGGGGASLGIAWATGRSPDVAINHDAAAIAMHTANHPEARGPEGLMYRWVAEGHGFAWRPVIWRRVGIPGSGGKQWYRADTEYVLAFTAARGEGDPRRAAILASLDHLRGKNLACWCPLDQPCHADALLELANRQETKT